MLGNADGLGACAARGAVGGTLGQSLVEVRVIFSDDVAAFVSSLFSPFFPPPLFPCVSAFGL